MTLRLFAPNPLVVGEPGNILVYSDNPGVVSLTYGAGLTGPASVTIEGTREYRLDGRGGDYLAIPAFGQSRDDVTLLFVVDWDRIVGARTSVAALITQGGLIGSWRVDAPSLCNWSIHARRYTSSGSASAISMIYAQSVNNGTSVAAALTYNAVSGYVPNAGPERWAITKTSAGVINMHRAERGVVATATVATTGTMGGTEALIMQGGQACSKILRVCSDAELDAWFADGTIPATNQEFSYLGNHEITDTPKVWDSTGANDLYAYQVPLWQAPGMSIRNVDTVPVVPYAIVPVTAVATTGTTIDATRPRQGVPDRAAYLEKTEVADQITVTVNEAPSSEQDVAMLHIYADRDGLATITCDVPGILDFPATLYVNEGTNVVSGDIVGAGVVNVTVELNGSTSVTPFTIDAIPLNLNIGPETTLDYEGLPITFKMIASCDHFDKTVNLSTTGVGITVPPTIYLNGAPVEFEVTVDGFGEYSVTGEVDGETSTADIHSIKEPNIVRIGPNSENEPTLHVSTNWPGVVTLTVVPDYGYTLPATVTVGTTLEADIEGTFVVHGTYVVTATFGAATDTCTAVYSNEDSEGCYIYGTLTDASGRPVRNATLTFKPIPTAQTIGSTILARTTKTARTDRLGAFEIRVLRGSILIVTCDILQYRKQITVPDQERVDLEDL